MSDDLIHRGRFLELYARNGWEFVRRTNASAVVAIAAMTDDDQVVLIEQLRPTLGDAGRRVIEIPAGLVGDDGDHDLLAAAQRELIEETGFEAAQLAIVTHGPSSAGISDEIITFVGARGLTRVSAGGGVADEAITVHLVPRAEVDSWLFECAESGLLIESRVWAALYIIDQM